MSRAWPADDEAALVCAALATGDDAALHWARFTTVSDLDDIWDQERYSMLPAIHLALRDTPGIAEAPRLAGIYRRTWFANQTALARAAEVLDLLGDSAIPACLHGDLAVAATVYPDLASRVAGDAQILVAASDAGAALEALSAAGWRRLDHGPIAALVAHTDGTLIARDGRDRLRLVWETCRGVADSSVDRASASEVIVQAGLLSTEHGDVTVTAPAALAVHAMCAGVGSQPDHCLRSVCDTAHIIAGTSSAGAEPADLDAVLSQVHRLGVAAVVSHTVETVAAVTGIGPQSFGAAVAAIPVSATDRRRHAVLVRAAGDHGRTHPLRAAWARRTVGLSITEAVRATPAFLSTRWGVRSQAMLPVEAARRAARAVGASAPIRERDAP